MKSVVAAAVLARIATAAPAPQLFDFAAVLAAPSPSVTGPPVGAESQSAVDQNTASIAASISSQVVAATSASITGSAASAAATAAPASSDFQNEKRGGWGWAPAPYPTKKSSSSSSSSSKAVWTSSSSSSSASASTVTSFAPGATLEPCSPQPGGAGPHVEPDTVEAFLAYPEFHEEANAAPAAVGDYSIVFRDLNASVSANSYLTYYLLDGYDVEGCASHCDQTDLCTAFNVFVERDPSINPNTNATDASLNCPNPASFTNYKCSLWGSAIDASAATNNGQWRDQFQVVITASNGYDATDKSTPPSLPGYNPPKPCSGGAINAGGDYWLGSNFYPGAFDPRKCQYYAQAQVAKNQEAAKQAGKSSYSPVNMFNAYSISKNGVPQGTYCSLFDTPLDSSWAGFTGGRSGSDSFGVGSSYLYSLSKQDSGSW